MTDDPVVRPPADDAAASGPEPAATPPEARPVAAAPAETPAPAAAPVRERGRRGPGLFGRTLQAIGLLTVGAVAALIFAPRILPRLPAEVAALIAPAERVGAGDLDRLRGELLSAFDERVATLEGRLDSAAAAGAAAAEARAATAALRADVAALQQRLGQAAPGDLARRVDETQTSLAGVTARLASLAAALEERETGAEISAEALERIAAIDGLEAEIGSLSERLGEVAQNQEEAEAAYEARLAEAEAAAAEAEAAAAEAEAAADASIAEAEAAAASARRRAALDASFAALTEAMALGVPYAGALAAVAPDGPPPPDALALPAERGLPTLEDLREGFIEAAREALAAQKRAEAEDGSLAQTFAGLRARVIGVPLGEVEGEGPDAPLGRAAARLAEGDVAGALDAIAPMAPEAKAELAAWQAEAELRLAAEAAAGTWRAALRAAVR